MPAAPLGEVLLRSRVIPWTPGTRSCANAEIVSVGAALRKFQSLEIIELDLNRVDGAAGDFEQTVCRCRC